LGVKAIAAVLVPAVSLFIAGCAVLPGVESTDLSSVYEETATRAEVETALGETDLSHATDEGRIDVYLYDRGVQGQFIGLDGRFMVFAPLIWAATPFGYALAIDEQKRYLTVVYDKQDRVVRYGTWPDAETPEEAMTSYERQEELAALEQARMADVEKRALEGDPEAMYEHGFGLGMSEHLERLRWYCLAAQHGHAMTRFQLGRYHHQGLVQFEDNSERAYRWYTLALEANYADAARYREKLSRDMTREQIAETERLVAEWEPDPEECERYLAQIQN
jgi:hypothetical protein